MCRTEGGDHPKHEAQACATVRVVLRVCGRARLGASGDSAGLLPAELSHGHDELVAHCGREQRAAGQARSAGRGRGCSRAREGCLLRPGMAEGIRRSIATGAR